MFDAIPPGAYLVFKPIYTACFLMWAFLWARVAWYYGTAAYGSWVTAGGKWTHVITDLFQPFWWAFRETLCRTRFFRGANFCGTTVPSPYEGGHLLRFSIFLGSLTPITFGLQFAELDRSTWTWYNMITTLFFALLSIIAAGGHLFLAFRSRPESWRKLVVCCSMWLIFSPFFIAAFYSHVSRNVLPYNWF